MKAAILTEYREPLVIEDITLGDVGPRGVRVKIDASGVCHSDVSVANGKVPMGTPMILGHEGAGTVLAVGPDVTRVKVGDHVIAAFIPACGTCFFCLHDQSHLCELTGSAYFGVKGTRADGAALRGMTGLGTFAEEMLVDEAMVVKIETDLPAEQLALLGCGVTTGLGAVLNTARVIPGSTVTVIGCGGVGQSVIQGARIAGASQIYAVDPVKMKRTTAEQFGATDLIDPADGDIVEQIKERTQGRGTDYAFEVIGLPETIVQAYTVARRGGTAVVVGMPAADSTVTLPGMSMFFDGKRMLGCVYGSAQVRRDFPRFVRLIEAGRLDVGAMVSRQIHLHEVNDAFRAMEAGEVIRSVIV
ncbi:MAG: Zn-dependent alcohol dehydrogenase [Acidimicrobiia bacterium]